MKKIIFPEIKSDDLKHCPFCNGKAQFYISSYDGDRKTKKWWFNIRCEKCLIKQSNIYELEIVFGKNGDIILHTDERHKAIEDWNRRCN